MSHQTLKTSLAWFSFLLSMDFWDICQHIYYKIIIRVFLYHLPDTFIINHTFDITYSPSDFNQTYFRCLFIHSNFIIDRLFGDLPNPMFNTITNVRDHLYCLAKLVALALFVNCLLEDPTTGEVVEVAKCDVVEPLLVAEVQVSLPAVVEHLHLPVFVWR